MNGIMGSEGVRTGSTSRQSDAAQDTAMLLELAALEAALAQHHTGNRPTPYTVTFHVPGMRMMGHTGVAKLDDALAAVVKELKIYMRRYGLTEKTLFSPASPIRIAFGHVEPAGNIAVRGNWPSMMMAVPATLSVFQMALNADASDTTADDMADMEIVVTSRRRA